MLLDDVLAPVRHAARGLVRSPRYAATAVLSVGGAIGLACSVFAVVQTTFLTPLPYRDADRLVQFWQTSGPGSSQPQDYLQPLRMEAWATRTDFRTIEQISATGMGPTLVMRLDDGPVKILSAPVLGDWFGTIGVAAARGRVLTPDDLRPGAEPAAVVSDRLWRTHLGAGDLRPLVIGGVEYAVVGVMPAELTPHETVWLPLEAMPRESRSGAFAGVARLRPGSSAEDAAAEIEQLSAAEVAADSGRFGGFAATAQPIRAQAGGPDGAALWMLGGVVLAVLLVALNNLTVLALVRAQARSGALAVRASLGASRWQLGRGLALEGVLIGGVGAALGLLLATWGKHAAVTVVGRVPAHPTLGVGAVLLALGLGVLVAVVIGIEPLRRVGSVPLLEVLQRRSGLVGGTPAERRTRQVLLAAQVATCLVLVAVAAVLGDAYRHFSALDVGIDATRVVQAVPDYAVADLDASGQWTLAERVVARMRGRPEVAVATAWRHIGEDYPPRPEYDTVVDGPPIELGRFDRLYGYYEVLPGFFDALGIPMVAGRPLGADDGRAGAPVAVVTARGADTWWPGESALGRRIKLGREGAWMTVVGVAADMQRLDDLGRSVASRRSRPMPLLFVPAGQFAEPPVGWRGYECCDGVMIAVRAAGVLSVTQRSVREVLAQEAPDLPLAELGTIHELQMDSYIGDRLTSTGRLVGFGVLVTLLLSVIGIVGVVSDGVARRTREIGVRVALGADALRVMWALARESVWTSLSGVAAGAVAIFALNGWLGTVIFDYFVQRLSSGILSPGVLGLATGVVLAVSVAAAQVTARRALVVDPVEALRAD